jgi:anti-sigma-K factor RskA
VSSPHAHFQKKSPTEGVWHSLNRWIAALIVVVVAVTIAVRFSPVLTERRKKLAELQVKTAQVEQEKQLVNYHALREEGLRTDAEYAGLIARDRIGLAAPGETIYSFPKRDRADGSARGDR